MRLGAIGLDIDEMNAHWAPDYRTIPHPDDPTRTLDVVRLQSRLNPGWFLCHDRSDGPIPGTDIPIVTSALTLKNTEDPQTGGIDLDWAMEFTSAPAAAALAKPTPPERRPPNTQTPTPAPAARRPSLGESA